MATPEKPGEGEECCPPVENGKNACWLVCKRCGSKIVEPGAGTFVEREIYLPFMEKKEGIASVTDGESLRHFFVLGDIFHFENVGFTLPIDSKKYLICADCEIGPIGVHMIDSPKEFFVAFHRVAVDETGSASKPRPQLAKGDLDLPGL